MSECPSTNQGQLHFQKNKDRDNRTGRVLDRSSGSYISEEGFDAGTGTSTAFAIRANEIQRTEFPYNNEDCRQVVDDQEINDQLWNYNGM